MYYEPHSLDSLKLGYDFLYGNMLHGHTEIVRNHTPYGARGREL